MNVRFVSENKEVDPGIWKGWMRSRRLRALSRCRDIDSYFPEEEK